MVVVKRLGSVAGSHDLGLADRVTCRLGKNEGSKDFASRSLVAWWEATAEARGELLVMFVLPTDLGEGGRIERRAGCEK